MPVAALVPAFTAGHWLNEIRFCRSGSALLDSRESRRPLRWKSAPTGGQSGELIGTVNSQKMPRYIALSSPNGLV